MNAADVLTLYAYDDWANDRMLAAIAELTEEQFTRNLVSSYPTIRDTLAHIAFAEWIWLERWRGNSPSQAPEWLDGPSFASLEERLHGIAAARRSYLTALTDERLDSAIHYRSTLGDEFTMILSDLLIHCANHSTYHRGQLVTMLRQVGATPPNTDFTPFARSYRVREHT